MPTEADRLLIEYAASRGYAITARQLKRWRDERLMPRRRRRTLGRGLGTTYLDVPWARFQAVAVAIALEGSTVKGAALRLWYQGWDIPTELIAEIVGDYLAAKRDAIDKLTTSAAEAQLGSLLTVSPFDVAEADSRSTPVTRAEQRRMTPLATSGHESARDLAHAVRVAAQGQLLSPPDEFSAIDEDQAKYYFGFTDAGPILELLGMTAQPVYEAWEQLVRDTDPTTLLQPPTTAELVNARYRLRVLFWLTEELFVVGAESEEDRQIAAILRSMSIAYPPRWDPRHRDHDSEVLMQVIAIRSQVHNPVKSSQ